MSFRARLVAVCVVLVLLLAALALGIIFSPDRVQARTAGRPLLSLSSTDEITGIEIADPGAPVVKLIREASGWKAIGGAAAYPVSADRLQSFLRTVRGLTRGKMVSRDASHFAELGLSDDTARRLILHRAGGGPDLGLLVGRRGPSGDEDYVRAQGEGAAYLVRGSLAFYLSQDRPYWYELHVLPDDVQGITVARVTVRGSREDSYTLERKPGPQSGEWTIDGDRPANRVVAGAMASALSLLEGEDFAEAPDAATAAGRLMDIEVTTLEGKKYTLVVSQDSASRKLLVKTSWSPWTYVVNPVLLQRAVRPLSALEAQ